MATAERFQISRSQKQQQQQQQQKDPLVLPTLLTLDLIENNCLAVYCFIKNFVGVNSCTSPVIDNKIEQSLKMVKTHLMYTMREEVEVLRERIVLLLDRIKQLELENDFLKSNATPEVLRALHNTCGVGGCKAIELDDVVDGNGEDLEVAAIIAGAQRQYQI